MQGADQFGNPVGADASGQTVYVFFATCRADGNTASWNGNNISETNGACIFGAPVGVTLNAAGQAVIVYNVVALPAGRDFFYIGNPYLGGAFNEVRI